MPEGEEGGVFLSLPALQWSEAEGWLDSNNEGPSVASGPPGCCGGKLYLGWACVGVVGRRELCLQSLSLESWEEGWESELSDSLLSLPLHVSPDTLGLF